MKKEVSPIIALVGIVLVLGVIQLMYWRGLVGGEQAQMPGGGGGGGGGGAGPPAPVGVWEATVTTLAGGSGPGYRDGEGHEALFDGPVSVAPDGAGSVYVADSRNHTVRLISAAGQVTTAAGAAGEPGYADGSAAEARFSGPAGVAVTAEGRVLVADTGNHRIRSVTADGVVSTYAGAETPRDDLGREAGGYRDGPTGQAQFCYPVGLAVDEAGTVYVADAGNHRVRRISPAGEVSTVPVGGEGELRSPTQLAVGEGDRLWVADSAGGTIWVGPREGPLEQWRSGEEGVPAAAPGGIAVLGGDAPRPGVYLLDAGNHCLWQVHADRVELVAGQQDPASPAWADGGGDAARFSSPVGLASGRDGELYAADFGNNCVRRVRFAGGGKEAY
jgi:hypothetical protein